MSRPQLPEAVIALLEEMNAKYGKECPFKAGQIVTPEAWGINPNGGEPHIVLEVLEEPIRQGIAGHFTQHCALLDMRVALLDNEGDILPLVVESWQFKLYETKE